MKGLYLVRHSTRRLVEKVCISILFDHLNLVSKCFLLCQDLVNAVHDLFLQSVDALQRFYPIGEDGKCVYDAATPVRCVVAWCRSSKSDADTRITPVFLWKVPDAIQP